MKDRPNVVLTDYVLLALNCKGFVPSGTGQERKTKTFRSLEWQKKNVN